MSMDHRAAAVRALARAGAPTADPTELTQWSVLHTCDTRMGVILDPTGHILAETTLMGGEVKVRYVTRILDPHIRPLFILNMEVGLALGGIRRETGRPAIHLAHWEVCKRHDTAEDTHPSTPPTMWTPPGTIEPEDIYAMGREDGQSMYE